MSRIKNLGKLNKIYGDAIFIDSSRDLIDLGQLTSIEGNATFRKSFIKSLGKLERVGGNLSLRDSKVTNLADLTYIGKNAFFENSLITNFNMLKYVGGDIYIEPQHIKDCINVDVKGDVVLGIETYSINELKDKASSILEKNKEMQKI